MLNFLWHKLFSVMSALSGQPVGSEWEAKARLIVAAGIFLSVFFTAFVVFYKKQFWHEPQTRRLFWWTVAILAAVVAGKFAIFHFAKGYVPDRALFYALPSPKFGGVLWLLPVAASLFLLWRWRPALPHWPARKFLAGLWLVFVLFSVGIAGLREGAHGIYEPLTRDRLEYVGDVRLVQSPRQFLHDYVALSPQLSEHGKTHPPGYALLLYALHKTFHANLFALALLIAALGGIAIVPVFYFWREFLPEEDVRTVFPVFVFIPSLVMFSATSMDIVSVTAFWLALAVSFVGWKKGSALSLLGGMLAGLALLMNFLFLAFGLVFLFFFAHLFIGSAREVRQMLVIRGASSLAGFVGFFAALRAATGYSVVANFFAARTVHEGVVASGASSISVYVLFALINVFAFFFSLGIPNIVLFFRHGFRDFFTRQNAPPSLGFCMLALFTLSCLFQGEVERIWLFLVPLFLPALSRALRKNGVHYGAAISLTVFQIVMIQILFYTYW